MTHAMGESLVLTYYMITTNEHAGALAACAGPSLFGCAQPAHGAAVVPRWLLLTNPGSAPTGNRRQAKDDLDPPADQIGFAGSRARTHHNPLCA
jgi:hypothetical protein